ncbi:unnamed protein product [Litomosoides sigmodontis]|uniref:Uncharacterized protein n=1 Tax=Litomosoides sigmodontis TaxID=42156 RepID=A0A3P6TGI8_LITSI|nr:unnamed protein product [Litomosoides sigmodontis]
MSAVSACRSRIHKMKKNRRVSEKRSGSNNVPPEMLTLFAKTQTTITSDTNPQNLSLTQKSDSKTQSVGEEKSKMNLMETLSKANIPISKDSSRKNLGTLGKRKLISYVDEKFKDDKLRNDKLDLIKQQIPTSSSVRIASSQDLPDFVHEGTTQPHTKRSDLMTIAQNLSKRKVQSTESSKTGKINYGETNQMPRCKSSGKQAVETLLCSSTKEKGPIQKHVLPSCMQYTCLRLIALILLFCAWIIVYAFPCLQFTYHVPVVKREMIESVAERISLKKTCQLMPHWWSDHKAFVGNIIESTRYFHALNLSMNQTEERFEIFEDENSIEILKPFNGQIFVIFGCVVLAFPILLLLMFLRCMSKEEDLIEEAMFDLAEISIFCVFSVIEFYMSSGAEIRAVMESMCVRYLERNIRINGYLKEKVYNICTDVKIEAYGFLSSGCIFLFLVFLFAIDLIILLKNAEAVESRKYLQMAACLHYDKTLKCVTESVLEGVSAQSAPLRK